mgnify:CR=1 FL=1
MVGESEHCLVLRAIPEHGKTNMHLRLKVFVRMANSHWIFCESVRKYSVQKMAMCFYHLPMVLVLIIQKVRPEVWSLLQEGKVKILLRRFLWVQKQLKLWMRCIEVR